MLSTDGLPLLAGTQPVPASCSSGVCRMPDRDVGLVRADYRYIDATPGRWLEEEPIAFAASDAHLHRYVAPPAG